jgi:hypothetical protein
LDEPLPLILKLELLTSLEDIPQWKHEIARAEKMTQTFVSKLATDPREMATSVGPKLASFRITQMRSQRMVAATETYHCFCSVGTQIAIDHVAELTR